MFSKRVTDTDNFLDMPLSTQALYFHLNMNADDDGFVGQVRKIIRSVGAKDDDLKLLIAKGLIFIFDTGVVVISNWYIHNYIRKDRYHETLYKNEKEQLSIDNDGNYSLGQPIVNQVGQPIVNQIKHDEKDDNTNVYSDGQPDDNQRLTEVRLGKVRLGKDNTPLIPRGEENEKSENPAKEMMEIFNQATNRNLSNSGMFGQLVMKNISVQEFKDVMNYVVDVWSEDVISKTPSKTFVSKFDNYSDTANELGFVNGQRPQQKKSANKPVKQEPKMTTNQDVQQEQQLDNSMSTEDMMALIGNRKTRS